jgi:signal transduction histidine kinase
VQDNGTGIALENREKIFEKFGQEELRFTQQRYSTGLGLTFCKLAVEAHGGRIGVDSAEHEGSSFWFELPVNGPEPLKIDARRSAQN